MLWAPSLCLCNRQARKGLLSIWGMSTRLFRSKSSSVRIGESCCHTSTRVISSSVLIVSLVITVLIFFPDHQTFWGFSCFFFPMLLNILALQSFRLVLVWPLIFSPSTLHCLFTAWNGMHKEVQCIMNSYTWCAQKGILMYTEVYVQVLYNDQYTSVSLY